MILFFEEYLAIILKNLRAVYTGTDSLAILHGFEHKIRHHKSDTQKALALTSFAEYFGVSLWIKDINSIFIYVNEICCNLILLQPIDDVLFQKDNDFKQNALSVCCLESDKKVVTQNERLRFLEFAAYQNGDELWLDICKMPRHSPSGRVLGVLGFAVNIAKIVPQNVKDNYQKAKSVEIPLEAVLSPDNLFTLLGGHREN